MQTTILTAIANITKYSLYQLVDKYNGRNRINAVGDALERFIKDSFAGTINETDESKRLDRLQKVFSYTGNQNNPPDIIIKNGDAIEVKKIENLGAAIALNSSFPKSRLYHDDKSLTSACRECERWSEKDIIYIVGATSNINLRHLWIVYGDCYAADREVYSKIKMTISEGVNAIPGVEFTPTKELGRINKVDPLGITNLRVRGMWHIDNPLKVFDYIYRHNSQNVFSLACLMKTSKFDSFPDEEREKLKELPLEIRSVKIKNPNNPIQLMDATLIVFEVKA